MQKFEQSTEDKRYKMLEISKIIFLVMPILYMLYVYYNCSVLNKTFEEVILQSPIGAITMINACVSPFCSYVIWKSIENLMAGKESSIILSSLIIVVCGQILVGNFLGAGVLAIGIYKCPDTRNLSIKDAYQQLKLLKSLNIFIYSVLIFMLSVFCFIVKAKIGF